MDLTEAEDIKRWQEYTEELYKKDLNDPGNHDGVITHLEPDIFWSTKSSESWETSLWTKLVEVMEFQLSYFKSWKMMLWKCCTQNVSKFGKLSSGHRTGKGQFDFSPKEEQCQRMFRLQHQFNSVQLLSCVWLFATPWITACQASLSIISARSLLKFMSIESVMPSSHLILCHPLLLLPPIPPSIRVFSNESLFAWGGQRLQHSCTHLTC